jgi:hypothetical protein
MGESIIASLELENVTTGPVPYLDVSRDVSLLANYVVIRVRDSNGSKLPENGPIIDPRPLEAGDLKTLGPGKRLTILLGDLVDERQARFWRLAIGAYSIDVQVINYISPDSSQRPAALHSNEKLITITE